MDRFQCVSMPSDPHNLFPRMFTIHSCIPDVHDTRNNGSEYSSQKCWVQAGKMDNNYFKI